MALLAYLWQRLKAFFEPEREERPDTDDLDEWEDELDEDEDDARHTI